MTGLLQWFQNWRLRRAARRYAGRLPEILKKGWGKSEYYTRGQIESAIRLAKLNPRYIGLAYAAYLPPELYADIMPAAAPHFSLPYEPAREIYEHYLPGFQPSAPLGEAFYWGGGGSAPGW